MEAIITREKRRAPKGIWVLGVALIYPVYTVFMRQGFIKNASVKN